MIRVLFFARLREQMGTSTRELPFEPGLTVGAIRQTYAPHTTAPLVQAALNQERVDDAALVNDGDEIAFFPPVTGG
ncbi:MAG: molybdopterin converting factor subunit 1 [Alphaproteobacteria bacterium CG_4_10_14_0_2_um_filter_63_37]|nr:MAG: molybdopterin converting factor subunit 1 [Proteobacteria bacterium CG1_02_64_396]PJA23681.1 MAG: molybdopterin converting factor subunit 1 [Alphaproteobacteria bacterium CG_4_10_14_0_2_um_filter_63_37]